MSMKIISFWGKGGVGKTTCAASVAARLASEGHSVLLVSSDYVPALSEVLAARLGPTLKNVWKELWAVELDEEAIIKLWKERFGGEVYRVISSFLPVGEEIIDYIAGAPGIADQYALYYVYELWRRGGYDYIVWDTMAAGGGLRMLRIERELYTHLGDAARMYLRLKGFLEKLRRGEGDPLSLIESWRELAERVLSFLTLEAHTAYIVTRPAYLDYAITKRIYSELSGFNMNVRGVIVNMTPLPEHYAYPEDTVAEARKWVEETRKTFKPKVEVIVVPFTPRGPRGIEELLALSEYLSKIA